MSKKNKNKKVNEEIIEKDEILEENFDEFEDEADEAETDEPEKEGFFKKHKKLLIGAGAVAATGALIVGVVKAFSGKSDDDELTIIDLDEEDDDDDFPVEEE